MQQMNFHNYFLLKGRTNRFPPLFIVKRFLITTASLFFPSVSHNHLPTIELDASNKDTRLTLLQYAQPPIPQMIYNKTHVVQYLCSPPFHPSYYPSHKSKQHPAPFQVWNWHQKLSLYKVLLLFNVNLPPQWIKILLIFTSLSNIPQTLFPNCIQSDILLLIQFRISLFRHLILRHICRSVLSIRQEIKHWKYIPFKSMQGYPTLGPLLIVNNPPCYF